VPVTVSALELAAVVREDPLQPPTSGAYVAGARETSREVRACVAARRPTANALRPNADYCCHDDAQFSRPFGEPARLLFAA
jgi:hypothetical protein